MKNLQIIKNFIASTALLLIITQHTFAQLPYSASAVLPSENIPSDSNAVISATDAARFLAQATFGPTSADISYLQKIGYQAWLDEQFSAPISLQTPYIKWLISTEGFVIDDDLRMEAWWINTTSAPDPSAGQAVHTDQLRQRIAFALSEIFVVSNNNPVLSNSGEVLVNYYDMLTKNSFGNYRILLEDVTKHPAMGIYLSMIRNQKANAEKNTHPDENYAREIMQLFSIGLYQLNLDGSYQLENSHLIPTYDQRIVRGMAAVFTGWNWADSNCTQETYFICQPQVKIDGVNGTNVNWGGWLLPMQPVEPYHDRTSDKQLLNYSGVALPNGLLIHGSDAQTELTAALDNIFYHPNVGPFISYRLIQRLVTSNPSPAYVQRVSQVFNDDGSAEHVRGNLKAVVQALLLDSEARNGHLEQPETFGKLREPLLKLTHLMRVMNATSSSGRLSIPGNDTGVSPDNGEALTAPEIAYGQAPLRAPSVFNFFSPDFQVKISEPNGRLFAPEFQILTDVTAISGANDLYKRIFYFYKGSTYERAKEANAILLDEDRDAPLALNDPAQLIDQYNLVFMSGQMSTFMRNTLLNRLLSLTDNSQGDLGRQRVQQALYLILNSPEYSIQK